ncbi:hypothetical protein AM571_PC02005 (plasmid) [Rhizobium etli 8C-3]|uniref:Uncharacterized protein n=1 Tax=Rhizobium etli 8C-3 TaxID=538025 RepID=A0A1L5PI40_RHIET|nr:hypothetical protein AM571_PC02005 [Rhizobium etli 8C-3]
MRSRRHHFEKPHQTRAARPPQNPQRPRLFQEAVFDQSIRPGKADGEKQDHTGGHRTDKRQLLAAHHSFFLNLLCSVMELS